MALEYKKCVERGLLRKIPPSDDMAAQSLKKADKWLKEAEMACTAKAFDSVVHAGYMVMFHASRSVLFRDGFREKSHACVARYLEEIYVKKQKLEQEWVDLLDHNRELRHSSQYDLNAFSIEEDALEMIETSIVFLARIKKLIK